MWPVSCSQNICKVRGWSTGDPNYENTKVVLANVWRGLQEKADADKDEEVNNSEVSSDPEK